MRLYHGTPNDFDKFDTEHIGQGEGAQVHGWGLYFAENKSIAKNNYGNILSSNKILVTFTVDDKSIQYYYQGGYKDYEKVVEAFPDFPVYLFDTLDYADTIEEAKHQIDWFIKTNVEHWNGACRIGNYGYFNTKEELMAFYQQSVDYLNSHKINIEYNVPESHLFTVSIPDDLIFVEETEKFSEMESDVQMAIIDAINELKKEYNIDEEIFSYDSSFEMIYFNMCNALYKNHDKRKLASLLLEKYGINGIHYYGERDGSCYVIFNPNNVEIIEKEIL